MKEFQKLKTWLKITGEELRDLRNALKNTQRSGQYAGRYIRDLILLQKEYRTKHIAYSMARGKKYEEIERYSRSEPDWKQINELMAILAARAKEEAIS